MNYRVSDYIVDFLVANGIKDVFLLPGGGCMHLIDSFSLNKKINIISCNHEQAASIAAESYGRTSDAPFGVCCVTSGPGSTNTITGVAGSWIESLPMLIISGQVKRKDMIGKRRIRQGGVQEVEILPVVKNLTKYAETITSLQNLDRTLIKAFSNLTCGRKGPVWLDVPLDIQAAPYLKKRHTRIRTKEHSKANISFSQIEKEFNKSERPLILAGHGVRIDGCHNELCSFVEKNNIPLLLTWNAMDILPYKNELYAGRPGVVAKRFGNLAVQNCDMLVSIGSRLDNVITAYDPNNFAPLAKKFIIDIDKDELKNCKVKGKKYCCRASIFLSSAMKFKINKTNRRPWIDQINRWKQKYQDEFLGEKTIRSKFSHYQAVESLSEHIPENSLICTGSSGLAIESFYVSFKNKKNQRIFLTSGLGSMGYGLPSAIGACVGNNYKRTFLIESDGSLMLNIQELATVQSYKLPLTIIMMNNSGYASIRNTQRNYFKKRFVGTGKESGNFYPCFKTICKAFNFEYYCVKNSNELKKAIHQDIKNRKQVLIDVMIKNNEQLAPKVSALPQSDGSMISMPLEDMSPLLPLSVLQNEMIREVRDISYNARKKISKR